MFLGGNINPPPIRSDVGLWEAVMLLSCILPELCVSHAQHGALALLAPAAALESQNCSLQRTQKSLPCERSRHGNTARIHFPKYRVRSAAAISKPGAS